MKGISVITAIALIADISNVKIRKWYQAKIDQGKNAVKYAWPLAGVFLPRSIRCLRKRSIIIIAMNETIL